MIKTIHGMNGPTMYLSTDADERVWLRDRLEVAVEASPKDGIITISLIDRQPDGDDVQVIVNEYTEQEWERSLPPSE